MLEISIILCFILHPLSFGFIAFSFITIQSIYPEIYQSIYYSHKAIQMQIEALLFIDSLYSHFIC
jgi:hypothetical protein